MSLRLVEEGLARVAGQSCLASPSVLQLDPCSEARGNIVQEEQDERNPFCSASYIIVTLRPCHQRRRYHLLIAIPQWWFLCLPEYVTGLGSEHI